MTLDAGLQHEIPGAPRNSTWVTRCTILKPGRTQHAIRALRRAAELLGRSPSVKAYRRVRDETHDPQLIPDSSIRSALGSRGLERGA